MTPDPFNLPPSMTRPQLEAWILFSIAVAGKSAKQTEKKMEAFYEQNRPQISPFVNVRSMIESGTLGRNLRRVKMGKYTLLNKAYRQAVQLDLSKQVTVEQLEEIHGIGPKSARMIVMYAYPGTEYAVLDTHVLKWLAAQGHDVPKATPTGKTYRALEQLILQEARKRNMTAREFDTYVWKSYAE